MQRATARVERDEGLSLGREAHRADARASLADRLPRRRARGRFEACDGDFHPAVARHPGRATRPRETEGASREIVDTRLRAGAAEVEPEKGVARHGGQRSRSRPPAARMRRAALA